MIPIRMKRINHPFCKEEEVKEKEEKVIETKSDEMLCIEEVRRSGFYPNLNWESSKVLPQYQ